MISPKIEIAPAANAPANGLAAPIPTPAATPPITEAAIICPTLTLSLAILFPAKLAAAAIPAAAPIPPGVGFMEPAIAPPSAPTKAASAICSPGNFQAE